MGKIGLGDLISWMLTIVFFIAVACLKSGDLQGATIAACGIIVMMFFITVSIEIIIETSKKLRGIGTLIGFITNGPETVCLIIGLMAGNILYATATPLGSNFANPVLILWAAILTRKFLTCFAKSLYLWVTVGLTATLSVLFFTLANVHYLTWVIIATAVTILLFLNRPTEEASQDKTVYLSGWLFLPAVIVLIGAGYFIDPIVNNAAEYSNMSKHLLAGIVLATLSSWPEFKSTQSFMASGRYTSAHINIAVSNISNIWLVALGTIYFIVT